MQVKQLRWSIFEPNLKVSNKFYIQLALEEKEEEVGRGYQFGQIKRVTKLPTNCPAMSRAGITKQFKKNISRTYFLTF